jgi:hypothetical protein
MEGSRAATAMANAMTMRVHTIDKTTERLEFHIYRFTSVYPAAIDEESIASFHPFVNNFLSKNNK